MKLCKACGVEKEPSSFYRMRKAKDGLQGHCKQCQRARIDTHNRSKAGKEASKRYNASPAGRARDLRYNKTAKGKARVRKYQKTPKGKMSTRRYQTSEKGREAQRRSDRKRYQEAKERAPKLFELGPNWTNLPHIEEESRLTWKEEQLFLKELERRKKEVRKNG